MIRANPERLFRTTFERAQLAPHIHAVRVDADLVLLDLLLDDYLLLQNCSDLDVSGNAVHGSVDTLTQLAADELLLSGPAGPDRTGPPRVPRVTLRPAARTAATAADAIVFLRLWCAVVTRRPTLIRLQQRFRNRRGDRADLEAIAARVEVFRQLLPLAPWTGACLLQTELLLRFLNAAGLDAEWVFGVRTWPFLAHCWLQIGDVSVSQASETLTMYRPIWAI
ncbi:lasso peptide biosynthesis B2 protein [Brevundimonas sp.]|uniref:lasso peptide biosynthesis B2 protein n=1 Tax=Brevundimonas sp. TaxID=1871086 RepID=UPI00289EBE44|nr:lasso peptide biosynthesis B2 protein [Brevundimonas sp.]